jgi:D-glycero-alpha-D-manno-heptose-7-phosphate kinase
VDLAGGTLDIWPLGMLHRGSITINVAIGVRVRLEMEIGAPVGHVEHAEGDEPWRSMGPEDTDRDLTAAVSFAVRTTGGARIRVLEQAPLGSGLGGSSAYAVALARGLLALDDRSLGDRALVALLRDLEARVLGVPTGIQDHWASVRGGVLAIHMEPGGESVERLAVDPEWLAQRLSVFYTGIVHHSGMVNWQVIRRRMEGEHDTIHGLAAIADASRLCRQALLSQDEREVAAAIAADWTSRKRLAPELCPPDLQQIEEVARSVGVAAVKACGAGGGGSLLLWHPAGLRDDLESALTGVAPGGRMLPHRVAQEGCQVLVGNS